VLPDGDRRKYRGNKAPGIRAALVHDAETARGARIWSHANVLALSLRATSIPALHEILDAWFATSSLLY
jgi:ribose 5-phosphate isomerase B